MKGKGKTIFDPHNLKKKVIVITGSSKQVLAEGDNTAELIRKIYGKNRTNKG